MYDGGGRRSATSSTSLSLLDRLDRLSRMASGSYLPDRDWCPRHLQSSTLTPSTACCYPSTDCDMLCGRVGGAHEVKKPHCY
eukprot:SAG25_NODE_560_length_6917_cov_7.195365_8_plen_82_part_00